MERRKDPRFKRRVPVRYWSEESPEPRKGFTLNVSQTGIFVSTSAPFSIGDWITIEMPLGTRTIQLQGIVRSSFRVDTALRRLRLSGMGIRLLRTEELMQALVGPQAGAEEGAAADSESESTDPEPMSQVEGGDSAVFSVYIDSPEDLADVFDRHIQHGGIFVPTSRASEVEKQVGVEFLFDWSPGTLIQTTGTIVQTFGGDRAKVGEEGLTGVGIAFSNPQETIDQFRQLIS